MKKTRKFYLIICSILIFMSLSYDSNGNGGTCTGTACIWKNGHYGADWACKITVSAQFDNCGPDISNTGHPLCGRAYYATIYQESNDNSEAGCHAITLESSSTVQIDGSSYNNTNGGALLHVNYTITFGYGGWSETYSRYQQVYVACYENKNCY